MRCPRCNSDHLSVVDSRADGESIRRRRECHGCAYRFTSYERVEQILPMVVKKDGRREFYNRDKIRNGLLRACDKRRISVEVIDRAVESIEQKIHELCVKEISSVEIGAAIESMLKGIDQIAYVRFASVYREFSDVHQFVETLKNLLDE